MIHNHRLKTRRRQRITAVIILFTAFFSLLPLRKSASDCLAVSEERETEGPKTDEIVVIDVIPIPCDVVFRSDSSMELGEEQVTDEGLDGEERIVRVIHCENGVPVSSETVDTRVLTEPSPALVLVGSGRAPDTNSVGEYIWPAEGVISSRFGPRKIRIGSSNHKGLDIANAPGSDVLAADGGEVIMAKLWEGSGYGNIVKLLHDNGDVTCYAHLDEILVSVGDCVAQGELIGKMGSTGNVTGPHLHFEVRPGGGAPADPMKYLPKR